MSATKTHHHDTIEAATRGKERPILFSTDMVRAILAGSKTQTRRIIKPQPYQTESGMWRWAGTRPNATRATGAISSNVCPEKWGSIFPSPYGSIGDRLWVRETWLPGAWDAQEGMIKAIYKADIKKSKWFSPYQDDGDGEKFNRMWRSICDELDRKGIHPDADGMYNFKGVQKQPLSWRPSIHMPRAACRLLLQITDIRVERLNSITPEDAIKEGCQYNAPDESSKYMYTDWYKTLWEKINGPHSWAANPWVWVITFATTSHLPSGEGPGVGLPSETPPSAPPHTGPEPAAPAAAPPGQPPA